MISRRRFVLMLRDVFIATGTMLLPTITPCVAQLTSQLERVGAQSQVSPDWQLVTKNAGWQARDSQGELVYNGRMWIFGGWFNSFEAPPRDVWNSADGKTWSLVEKEAPWIHSDLPMSVTFKDRMWMMGGWYNGRLDGHSASNSVWASTDGVEWDLVAKEAGWSARQAAATVVFKDAVWILGGSTNYYFGDDTSLKNDVWFSSDGKEWHQATTDAGWAPRAYHQTAVLNDRIYVFGGGNYVPEYKAFNDVWSSADGATWRRETEAAPWAARLWFSGVNYRDHMWMFGGWSNNPAINYNDVWFSKNGSTWHEFKTKTIWNKRHEQSAFVFQDRIWLSGGHAQPLSNEVWSLQLPEDWDGSATAVRSGR